MKKYYAEKYNASDDSIKITEVLAISGNFVNEGDLLFSIETSKTSIDIDAEMDGYVYFNFTLGQNISIGELYYLVSETVVKNWESHFIKNNRVELEGDQDVIITHKAKRLLEKYSISHLLINKKVIKEVDVINYYKTVEKSKQSFNDKLIEPHATIIDKSKFIIILGAGGGAKMCIDAIKNSNQLSIIGLLDDNIEIGNTILDYPVIGNFMAVDKLISLGFVNYVIAFGVIENRQARFELFKSLKKSGARFPNIIHPKAIVESSVTLGEGNVFLAGSNIGSCAKIGDLNYVNNNSLISHDCILEDNVHVAPGAVIASSVKIKSNVLIGMNSTIYIGIHIGKNSTINNGLIINNDVKSDIIQNKNN